MLPALPKRRVTHIHCAILTTWPTSTFEFSALLNGPEKLSGLGSLMCKTNTRRILRCSACELGPVRIKACLINPPCRGQERINVFVARMVVNGDQFAFFR